jgi:hypothetical protein
MSCGVAERPARRAAGSDDGKTLKMMNVRSITMNSNAMHQSSRRMM